MVRELHGKKRARESTTIQGAVLTILSSALGIFSVIHFGAPPEILVSTVTTGGTAVIGGIMSIIGRLSAAEKIGK